MANSGNRRPTKSLQRSLLGIGLTAMLSCAPIPQGSKKNFPDADATRGPFTNHATEWPGLKIETTNGPLKSMGYSIQVGAFAELDNAVRLENLLQSRGIDAYYFRHHSGLYKVRFGNHGSLDSAQTEAARLQQEGLLDGFYVVAPGDYPATEVGKSGLGKLRSAVVLTAKQFIGVPYRWGGSDAVIGFDCSGLTMVSYRLNGLDLPRNSYAQFKAGRPINKGQLRPGDLVFFATKGDDRVTHVGMYIGEGKFIHAPGAGKMVRIETLSKSFFTGSYVGARSYL